MQPVLASERRALIVGLGLLPPPASLDLVHAALARDDGAFRVAWSRWRQAHPDLDVVSGDAQRILQAIALRLGALEPNDPHTERIRGLHRRAHYRHHLLVHRTTQAVDALLGLGIPVMLIKGAALAETCYREPGARAMSDVDAAVPHRHMATATAALRKLEGWSFNESVPVHDALKFRHGIACHHRDGFGLDLHQHLLQCASWPDADAPLWDASVPLAWRGRAVRQLAPADQLFHALVQDTSEDRAPTAMWVVDAAAIVTTHGSAIDWDRLPWLAERTGQAAVVEGTLRLLAERFGQPVPQSVVDAAARLPIPASLVRYRAIVNKRGKRWLVPQRVMLRYWLRQGRGRGALRAALQFPEYLRLVAGQRSMGALAMYALERLARAMGRRVAGHVDRQLTPAPR